MEIAIFFLKLTAVNFSRLVLLKLSQLFPQISIYGIFLPFSLPTFLTNQKLLKTSSRDKEKQNKKNKQRYEIVQKSELLKAVADNKMPNFSSLNP